MIVEIPVSVASFAGELANMRDWPDANHCTPVRFETKSQEPGVVLIRVEFNEADDAEAFWLAFNANELSDSAL